LLRSRIIHPIQAGLEVQQTFIGRAKLKTVESWRRIARPTFEFNVKRFKQYALLPQ